MIYFLCLALFTSGCTSTGNGSTIVVNKRHAQFGMANLPDGWQKKSFREADLFFEHSEKKATIFISSQCEKFSDSPLEAMTSQMLVGMGKYEITSQNRVKVGDREALVSEVMSNLDGIDVFLKIMVMRKNRCIFDAVFTTKRTERDLVKDFDALIASFWAEADL